MSTPAPAVDFAHTIDGPAEPRPVLPETTETTNVVCLNSVKSFLGNSDEHVAATAPEVRDQVEYVKSLSNEELFPLGERALKDICDDIIVLNEIRNRFRAANGAGVMGYQSWREFVERNSRYSIRTVQRRLNQVNGVREYTALNIQAEYNALNGAIHNDINTTSGNLKALLLKLYDMQKLLSLRGANRSRQEGLPTWTQYFEGFKAAIEYKLDFKNVQREFRQMSASAGTLPAPRPKPLALSAHDRRRLVEAAAVGNEIVEAWEKHGDVESAVREYKRLALDSRKLDSIIDPPEPTNPNEIASGGWWEELYHKLNALVPTISDGAEHVTVVMLQRALTEPAVLKAEQNYRQYVIARLRQISEEFTGYADTLESPPATVPVGDDAEAAPYGDYHADLPIGPRRGGMSLFRLRADAKQLGIACKIGVVPNTLVRIRAAINTP